MSRLEELLEQFEQSSEASQQRNEAAFHRMENYLSQMTEIISTTWQVSEPCETTLSFEEEQVAENLSYESELGEVEVEEDKVFELIEKFEEDKDKEAIEEQEEESFFYL